MARHDKHFSHLLCNLPGSSRLRPLTLCHLTLSTLRPFPASWPGSSCTPGPGSPLKPPRPITGHSPHVLLAAHPASHRPTKVVHGSPTPPAGPQKKCGARLYCGAQGTYSGTRVHHAASYRPMWWPTVQAHVVAHSTGPCGGPQYVAVQSVVRGPHTGAHKAHSVVNWCTTPPSAPCGGFVQYAAVQSVVPGPPTM